MGRGDKIDVFSDARSVLDQHLSGRIKIALQLDLTTNGRKDKRRPQHALKVSPVSCSRKWALRVCDFDGTDKETNPVRMAHRFESKREKRRERRGERRGERDGGRGVRYTLVENRTRETRLDRGEPTRVFTPGSMQTRARSGGGKAQATRRGDAPQGDAHL